MNVLITGAAGYIGRRLTAALEREHRLVLGDVQPIADRRWRPLDVTRLDQAITATQGVDAVVHLAVASGHEGDYEDDAFNQQRFDVNVKGTWNMLEAARRAGVARFVHTSSLMVVWGYPPPARVPGNAPPWPVGTYALTKQLAEQLCEHFARKLDMSIVCVRISKPIEPDDPRWRERPIRPQWIAFPDLIEAYRCALAAKDIAFEIVTIVGESSRRRWDLDAARDKIGYRPSWRLEEHGFVLGDEREAVVE
jgi:uronate dehydrogenase